MNRLRLVQPALLVLILCSSSCGATGPLEEPQTKGCRSDIECRGDRICHEGTCVFPEDVDREPTEPEAVEVGDPCDSDEDCALDHHCLESFPGGYCTLLECDDGCPEGSSCVSFDGIRACLKVCAELQDCREGYVCYPDGAGGRVCLPYEEQTGSLVGGPCGSAADCEGDHVFCWTDWPGGYCFGYGCNIHDCPEGSSCHRSEQGDFICYADCEVLADCGREEYACWHFEGGGLCLPHCSKVDMCLPGETCNERTGVCE